MLERLDWYKSMGGIDKVLVAYINATKRIIVKMIRKARRIKMEKPKGNFRMRNSVKKGMKQFVKVRKKFAVNISSCSSA